MNDPHASVARARESFDRLLLDMAGLQPGEEVLDIGTGTGYLAFPMAQAGARVHGIDIAGTVICRNAGEAVRVGRIRIGNLLFRKD